MCHETAKHLNGHVVHWMSFASAAGRQSLDNVLIIEVTWYPVFRTSMDKRSLIFPDLLIRASAVWKYERKLPHMTGTYDTNDVVFHQCFPERRGTKWVMRCCVHMQCFLFQNKKKTVLDALIQKIFLYTMKINNFWGDLTDNSAKKEALYTCTTEWGATQQNIFLDRSIRRMFCLVKVQSLVYTMAGCMRCVWYAHWTSFWERVMPQKFWDNCWMFRSHSISDTDRSTHTPYVSRNACTESTQGG